MPTSKKTPPSPMQKLRALQSENAALKKKMHELEAERDSFRRAVHAWAKAKVTAADLQEWMRDEPDSGRTILDVVAQIKNERR